MTRKRDSGSQARRARFRSPSAMALLGVCAAAAAAGAFVYWKLVLLHPPPMLDEAAHALNGALIARDLRELDVPAFLIDSYLQIYWPPLHSWLLAPAFLVAGPSLAAARAVSVLCYVLLAPVVFLTARLVAPRHRELAGCIAAAVAIGSPGVAQYAGMAMLETPSLLALSGAILVYCRLERDPQLPPVAHVILGLAVVATYLAKAPYGILLILSVLLARGLEAGFRPHGLLTRRNLYAALPVALFAILWFAYPPKLPLTWNALVNHPSPGDSAAAHWGLSYYPRGIAWIAGSWWMALLLWTGLAVAYRSRDRPGVPFLAILALTMFVIGEIHHTKDAKHILPMIPPMAVLLGLAVTRLLPWFRSRGRVGMAAAGAAAICTIAIHGSALAGRDLTEDWIYEGQEPDAAELDFVFAQVRAGAPALVLGTQFANPPVPEVDWLLVSAGLMPVTRSAVAMKPPLLRGMKGRVRAALPPGRLRAGVIRTLDRYDRRSANPRTIHAAYGISRTRFQNVLAVTLGKDPTRTIVVLVGISDPQEYSLEFVAPAIEAGGFQKVAVREFPVADTRVHVFRRRP